MWVYFEFVAVSFRRYHYLFGRVWQVPRRCLSVRVCVCLCVCALCTQKRDGEVGNGSFSCFVGSFFCTDGCTSFPSALELTAFCVFGVLVVRVWRAQNQISNENNDGNLIKFLQE